MSCSYILGQHRTDDIEHDVMMGEDKNLALLDLCMKVVLDDVLPDGFRLHLTGLRVELDETLVGLATVLSQYLAAIVLLWKKSISSSTYTIFCDGLGKLFVGFLQLRHVFLEQVALKLDDFSTLVRKVVKNVLLETPETDIITGCDQRFSRRHT